MYKKILVVVASDGVRARIAAKEGVALARVHGAEVLFFHVLPRYILPLADMPMMGMPLPDQFQDESHTNAKRILVAATAIADKADVRSASEIGAGADDADCILKAAKKRRCDLILITSSGRNAVMRILMGSVIPGLITLSTIPVLICRHASRERAAAPKAKGTARAKAASA